MGGGPGGASFSGFAGVGGAPGFPDEIDYGAYSPGVGAGGSSWIDRQDDYDMESE